MNYSYDVHIIYGQLEDGEQFQPYADTVKVRGGTAPYSFSIISGTLPGGLTLNTTDGIISGTPVDTGLVQVSIRASGTTGGNETELITFHIAAAQYLSGDADHSGGVNISDAVYIISYVFNGGPAPNPMAAGDADCSGIVNISDAVYLINYVFAGGPAPCL